MKLNLFDQFVVKMFCQTFRKVYKIGMADAFNFLQYSPPIPRKILCDEKNNCNKKWNKVLQNGFK